MYYRLNYEDFLSKYLLKNYRLIDIFKQLSILINVYCQDKSVLDKIKQAKKNFIGLLQHKIKTKVSSLKEKMEMF